MLNIVSICISAVALVVAIYSVVYTQYLNRFALIVCDAYIDQDEPDFPFLLSFKVMNDSPKFVVIESLTISDNVKLCPEFTPPDEPLTMYEEQDPFCGAAVVPSGGGIDFSYYCEAPVSSFIVTITAYHRINRFSKTHSFPVYLYQKQ